MKKRILSFIMAVVMIIGMMPTNLLAATYGTYLGWEYAYITPKSSGGYNLYDPTTSGSSYSDYDYSDKVTVTYSGAADSWQKEA